MGRATSRSHIILSYTTEVDRPYRHSGSGRTTVLSSPGTQREDCCHSSGVGQRTATKPQPGQLALQNQRPLKHLWQVHSTCTHTHALRAPRRDVPISTSHLSCHVNPLSTHPSRSQTGGKERKKGQPISDWRRRKRLSHSSLPDGRPD